jgi:hypothetical protein
MVYEGFVAETYPARSFAVSVDRLVNWFPEVVESKLGKSAIYYLPTPGTVLHCDTSQFGAGRGMFALDGRQWAVVGKYLIEFDPYGAYIKYPNDWDVPQAFLEDDGKPVTIVANSRTPPQLMIASGGHGYIFDTGTGILSQITGGIVSPDLNPYPGQFLGSTMCAFLDTYFIALTPDSRSFQISQVDNDGMTWDANDVSANLGSADKIKAIITDHEYLYLAGSKRMAVYCNTGAAGFPFTPVPGAFIEVGIRAPYSIQRIDNTIMFYGENEHGAGSVYRMEGFAPRRVSTHAIEAVWDWYGEDVDAVAFTEQREGHTFYRLTFPAQDQTWVYDLATDMWHERAVWDPVGAEWHAQTQRFHCYATGGALGFHFVLGKDGKIYREAPDVFTENGALIRRVRIAPVIANQNKMMFVSRLEVIVQPAIGLDGDPLAVGANPTMTLRYSPDSGQTWSSEISGYAGRIGNYLSRVIFDQLGSGRAWVPEISVTDPNNWVIVAANVEVASGAW